MGTKDWYIYQARKWMHWNGVPRCISLTKEPPLLVFTDGACEGGTDGDPFRASVGGVLLEPEKQPQFFSGLAPDSLTDLWTDARKKHLIGQVELYAVILARAVWSECINNRRVIFFVDNMAVLDALIRGNSREPTWRALLLQFERDDGSAPCFAWFCCVPSVSNVSDGPSRGQFQSMKVWQAVGIRPECPITHDKLCSIGV